MTGKGVGLIGRGIEPNFSEAVRKWLPDEKARIMRQRQSARPDTGPSGADRGQRRSAEGPKPRTHDFVRGDPDHAAAHLLPPNRIGFAPFAFDGLNDHNTHAVNGGPGGRAGRREHGDRFEPGA
jgi:hypothetical protein